MGWSSNVVEQRRHALDLVAAGVTVSRAAELVGVTRQCLHKWLKRCSEEGDAGLEDRSRAPKEHPHAVSEAIRRRVLRLKARYPDEGARKIREYLLREKELRESLSISSAWVTS